MGTALGFLLPRTYDVRPRVWIEKLEIRRLFSVAGDPSAAVLLNDADQPVATAQVIGGILTVVTSDGADDVMLGTARGDANQLFIYVNGARTYFSRAEVTGVSVDLGDGDDGFAVQNWNGLLNLPTTVIGGAGDDAIGGENEFDYVNDRIRNLGDGPFAPVHLIGGEGNDTLVGGIGDTVAEGGAGANQMYGRKGLFTILDAPANVPTPIAQFIDDGGEAHLTDYYVDAPVVGTISPISTSDPIFVAGEINGEPEAPGAAPAAATPTGVATAAPLTPTAPNGNPGSGEDSLLTSEGSLLGQRDNELWG